MTNPLEAIIGQGEAMRRVREQIVWAAECDEPLLITGERGTGKELAARAVVALGRRRGAACVVVDCAALPLSLAESELFGHERGAFTGAVNQRIGRLEEAQGGTLILDEIGHLGLPTQASLLRVLEYGGYRRLGGRHALELDARVIAATNADLESATRTGAFLPDLYDRLNVLRIHLPPLRERREDVPLLAQVLWQRAAPGAPALPAAWIEALATLPLPGNVRELRNLVIRLAIVARRRPRLDDLALEDMLWDSRSS